MAEGMADRRRRGPREAPPRAGTAAPRPPRARPAPAGEKTELSPHEYRRHLEQEHGLRVTAERGWPTAIKRYRLTRPAEGKQPERVLATFVGTEPEALAHFYRYLHPASPVRLAPARAA